MTANEKWKLIARYVSQECTNEEKTIVNELQKIDVQFQKMMEWTEKVCQISEKPIDSSDVNDSWMKLESQIDTTISKNVQKSTKRRAKIIVWPPLISSYADRLIRLAAVFIFALCLSYFYTKGFTQLPFRNDNDDTYSHEQLDVISVKKCKRAQITLNDGTKITLDAGSELEYPTKFRKTREVNLKGEAYFEVAYDTKRPFLVHANYALIRVLGTKFNIRAWNENPAVSVTVTEGKVALSRSDETNQKTVVIPKGHSSSLAREGLPSAPIQVDVDHYLSWMHNEIDFQDASLKEVLAQLERWHDFQFDAIDNSLLEQRITVHIRKTNIDDVLELISMLTDTKIIKDGKLIRIIAN